METLTFNMQKLFHEAAKQSNNTLHSSKMISRSTAIPQQSNADKREFIYCGRKSVPSQCLQRLLLDYLNKKQRQLISFFSALDTIISYFEKAWKRCRNVRRQQKCEFLIVSQTDLVQLIPTEILTITFSSFVLSSTCLKAEHKYSQIV